MENQNNKKVFAVLLDTVSIQKYIFSGRKLKEFIGASYLVDWIYDEPILEALRKVFPSKPFNLLDWKKNPTQIKILQSEEFEVGYIGGGNALLLFKKKEMAEEFVRNWTLNLLHMAPGLIPSAAISEFNFDNYVDSVKKLFEKLEEVKNSYPVNVFIPRHGISAECQLSGGPKEVYHSAVDPKESGYISSILKTKLNYTDVANKKFEQELLEEHQNSYSFTTEIDRLGQREGEENYIAIVHIDGNSTGKLFRNCEDLEKTRKLSKYLKETTLEAMKRTVIDLIRSIDEFESKKYLEIHEDEDINNKKKKYLPLRPIIIGGDDVTFVSHGRLGVCLAEKYIEKYQELTENNEFNIKFTLSAGVMITKSHMPFFRAYQLSENLCAEAKKKRRDNGNAGSWIDFHIAYGGFTGTIKEIRKSHYTTPQGPLYMRPYPIDAGVISYRFEDIKEGARYLKEKFPRSKVMELRKILSLGDIGAAKIFTKKLKLRGLDLPDFNAKGYNDCIWKDGQTPYFDMIELIEIYPF